MRWASGDRVILRGEDWRVLRTTAFADCAALDLVSHERPGLHRTFLVPFDSPRLAAPPRPVLLSTRSWCQRVSALLADSHPFGGLRCCPPTIRLLPYQLEPALAIFRHGATRLLVADDVGVGKTVEAGLIIGEVVGGRHGARVLILCTRVVEGPVAAGTARPLQPRSDRRRRRLAAQILGVAAGQRESLVIAGRLSRVDGFRETGRSPPPAGGGPVGSARRRRGARGNAGESPAGRDPRAGASIATRHSLDGDPAWWRRGPVRAALRHGTHRSRRADRLLPAVPVGRAAARQPGEEPNHPGRDLRTLSAGCIGSWSRTPRACGRGAPAVRTATRRCWRRC